MANIAIKYVGLTGQKYDLTIDNGQTVTQLRAAIATAEGLTLSYYGNVSLLSDISKNYLNNPTDTLATIGAVADSIFLCTPEQDSIDKENRQIQKLEIAQEKRQADGDTTKPYYRNGNVYDLTSLPDTYNGNSPGADDNPNTGGLIQGRPWVGVAELAAPETIEEALPAATLLELESWYDGSDGAYFVPNNPSDGQTFTQWKDKSAFAHNANPIGGATTRASYQTNELNTLSVVRFDGNDGLDINPYASLASAPALTVFVVMKMTATAGNPVVFATDTGLTALTYDTASSKFLVKAASGVGTSTVANNSAAFHIHVIAFDGSQTTNAASLKYRYDKTDITLNFGATTVGDTLSASNTRLYIGNNNGSNFFTGDIAEFLIFTKVLTATEITNVENYLSNKWGL